MPDAVLPPAPTSPRVPPGRRPETGAINSIVIGVLRIVGGTTGPPNVFATLARNRGLFRRWLVFAGGLMPGGKLPRFETELLILRVSVLCECEYEWLHHLKLGAKEGVTPQIAERIRRGPDAEGWTPRQAALLRGADELHHDRVVSDETWARLETFLPERQLIEYVLLVGHYEMLAMAIRTLGVQPDTFRR